EGALAAPTIGGRAAWVRLLAEAIAIADDDRVAATVHRVTGELRASWPGRGDLLDALASVDACLQASVAAAGDAAPAPIDELERIVGAAYRPGEGLVDIPAQRRASAAEHVGAASTLLTAFELTGRLPYSMLAEELMQVALRSITAAGDLSTCCEAARAL